jgi:raffinose/stachyose/melibiose transport system permease protein
MKQQRKATPMSKSHTDSSRKRHSRILGKPGQNTAPIGDKGLMLFAVPALVLYSFVLAIPTLRGSVYGFTNWNGLTPDWEFVGFENFIDIFQDDNSSRALVITFVIAISVTVIQNLIGLLLALGVHSQIKSRYVLRVFLFAPAVLTPVVTAYLWKYIYSPNGPLDEVLAFMGLEEFQQSWLGDPTWALISVINVIIWQFAGFSMVIFLAGLESIPKEIDEAAAVDGAGFFQRTWNITLPLLAPALTINLMLSMIAGFKLFDQVWVMTGGGPAGATNTLSTLIYKNAFQYGEFGPSIALALLLMVLVATVSVIQYRGLISKSRQQ